MKSSHIKPQLLSKFEGFFKYFLIIRIKTKDKGTFYPDAITSEPINGFLKIDIFSKLL